MYESGMEPLKDEQTTIARRAVTLNVRVCIHLNEIPYLSIIQN